MLAGFKTVTSIIHIQCNLQFIQLNSFVLALRFSGFLFSATATAALVKPTTNAEPPTLAASINNLPVKTAGNNKSPVKTHIATRELDLSKIIQ